VHVSETLNVAARSLDAMQHHHERIHTANNVVRDSNACKRWDKVGSRFEFQLRFLEGLLQRSEANNARIQNEITLVSPAYKGGYAMDYEAYNIRLSMLQPKETARFSCR
jgi:hypothetical protein